MLAMLEMAIAMMLTEDRFTIFSPLNHKYPLLPKISTQSRFQPINDMVLMDEGITFNFGQAIYVHNSGSRRFGIFGQLKVSKMSS